MVSNGVTLISGHYMLNIGARAESTVRRECACDCSASSARRLQDLRAHRGPRGGGGVSLLMTSTEGPWYSCLDNNDNGNEYNCNDHAF